MTQGRSVGRSSTKCSGIQTGWRTNPTLLQGRYLSAKHTMRGASVRMNMAERETLLWVMERWRTKRDALHHGINRFGRRLLRLCDRMYGCNIGNRRVGQKGRLGWYMTAIPLLHRVVCVVEKDVAPPDPCSGARLERVTYRIHNLNASVRVKNSVTSPALEGKVSSRTDEICSVRLLHKLTAKVFIAEVRWALRAFWLRLGFLREAPN